MPLITGFKISGFEPVYTSAIELKMKDGPYVVLGGNGLGKTTLMQAIVYGLAGGLDDKIEDVKSFRWSNSYFRGRLDSNQAADASVEVDFRLGRHSLTIRRGFRSAGILAVRDGRSSWIVGDAQKKFSSLLKEYGGYLDPSDFAFIVHRLLYLPESRRLIAWDTEAQIRLLMLLNQDIAIESSFREKRARLKFLDSTRRHIHVALNKAKDDLASLLAHEPGTLEEDEEDPNDSVVGDQANENLPALVAKLSEIGRKRIQAEHRERTSIADLSKASSKIDGLRQQIEVAEAALVANFLSTVERNQNLALSKLIQHAICPACGRHDEALADLARTYLRNHSCVICGQEESHMVDPQQRILGDALAVELRGQQAFEEVVQLARLELQGLREHEAELQARVNEIRYSNSAIGMAERFLPTMTVESVQDLKKKLENDEADAAAQIHNLQKTLAAEYADFQRKMDARMQELRRSYAEYATHFMGLSCELEDIPRNGLLELRLFVPSFGGIVRQEAESCSEAQRFFLDIAFRMALIDAAGSEYGAATFLCETPETALDVSYVDNVVTMFTAFAKREHNILLTANIQVSGIAEKLLRYHPKDQRASRVINLLEIGRLSNVQLKARAAFNTIVKRMMSAPMLRPTA